MKRRLFFKNALILTATSLLLRTVGIVFRLYLSGKIGAEGMGLYQLIVSIYVLGSTFATSGISTAVTRMVADEMVCGTPRSVRHILRRAVALSVGIGVVSTLIIYLAANPIGKWWIQDLRAVPALKMLAFSLPSMGISACLKGYFAARRRVGYPSIAQLLEQAVRIGLIAVLIDRFAAKGLAHACLVIMLADTAAEWVSCLFVAVGYWFDRRRLMKQDGNHTLRPRTSVVRQLFAIAAPITAGRYLNTALRTVENLLVPANIARYCGSREQGLSQFGALKGMALPLIFFPASFLSAMSSLLLPELSAANACHQQNSINRAVEKALRITLLASLLIGAVFTVFADPIGRLLYGSAEVGIYLRVLAPLTPIMYTESIVDGMLKGLNQQVSSLKYSLTDSALRIVMIVFLVPARGMGGFLFIMVVSNALTSFLNLNRLLTVTGMRPNWYRLFVLPLIGAVIASVGALAVEQVLPPMARSDLWHPLIGTAVLSFLYAMLLLLFKCVSVRDILLDRRAKKGYDECR